MTRALTREAGLARQRISTGTWRLAAPDAEAAADVLARLTAPLPVRRGSAARTQEADRDRRLQRVLRTAMHHLDAGGQVGPPTAALLAAVARALLPWHAAPNPPAAAAAPRYGAPRYGAPRYGAPRTTDGMSPPTDAGEALLPGLIALFTDLVATGVRETIPLTPEVEPWQVRYEGRFRRHARPAPGVWTAETVGCPECGGTDGPWTVTCDWRRVTLGCACGAGTDEHGLALSEVWLVLPDA
ncbi:hypothetical protein [Streptomyces sp. NPDC054866]